MTQWPGDVGRREELFDGLMDCLVVDSDPLSCAFLPDDPDRVPDAHYYDDWLRGGAELTKKGARAFYGAPCVAGLQKCSFNLREGTKLTIGFEQRFSRLDPYFCDLLRPSGASKDEHMVVDMAVSLVQVRSLSELWPTKAGFPCPIRLVAVEMEARDGASVWYAHKGYVKLHQALLSMNATLAAWKAGAHITANPKEAYLRWIDRLLGELPATNKFVTLAVSYGVLSEDGRVCVFMLQTVARRVGNTVLESHISRRLRVQQLDPEEDSTDTQDNADVATPDLPWYSLSQAGIVSLLEQLTRRACTHNDVASVEHGLHASHRKAMLKALPVKLCGIKDDQQPLSQLDPPQWKPGTDQDSATGGALGSDRERLLDQMMLSLRKADANLPGNDRLGWFDDLPTPDFSHVSPLGRVVKVVTFGTKRGCAVTAIGRAPGGLLSELATARAAKHAAADRSETCHVMDVYAAWSRSFLDPSATTRASVATLCIAETLLPLHEVVGSPFFGGLDVARNVVAVALDVLRGLASTATQSRNRPPCRQVGQCCSTRSHRSRDA